MILSNAQWLPAQAVSRTRAATPAAGFGSGATSGRRLLVNPVLTVNDVGVNAL